MRLTIVTPTIGRASLTATLASIAGQLAPGDEHLVIGDGVRPEAAEMCARFGATYHDGPVARDYGNTQRDIAAQLATGDYMLYCDDDDTFTPDALDIVRAALWSQPDMPHIFKMRHPVLDVLWQCPALVPSNVGTPMFCVPRDKRMARWNDLHSDTYQGDFRFITRTVANHGGRCAWQEGIVCSVGQRV